MSESRIAFEPGQIWQMQCPFIQEEISLPDVDGFAITKSWRPGLRYEPVAPDDYKPVCDGSGHEFREIIAVVPIPGWPTRIFYTRHYLPPTGPRFGKKRLRVTTAANFRRWTTHGYGSLWNDLDRQSAELVQEQREAA